MKVTAAIAKAYEALLSSRARSAVVYLDPRQTVKVTRQGKHLARAHGRTYLVTVGKPNFADRAYIKTLVKAGEPFPVKRVRLRGAPKV